MKPIIQLVLSISSFQLITKIATVMSCISFYLLQGVGMWREEENISCQDIDVVKNKNLEAVTVEQLQA